MSRNLNRTICLLSGLAAGAAAALTYPAVAQQVTSAAGGTKPVYMDHRMALELKDGVPPVGTPKAKGVPSGPGSLTGIWFNTDAIPLGGSPRADMIHTADGELPPFQPWAAAVVEQRVRDDEAGHPYATTKSLCLPAGVPEIMVTLRKNGLKIIEQPTVVTILVESMNHFRQIFLNAAHNPDAPPSFFGDSIGHWEGDTLIVETINFNEDAVVSGLIPHSDALRVTERLRRLTPTRLEYIATIDDPKTFTKPWTMPRRTLELKPQWNIMESVCTNQRNAPDASGRTSVQLPSASQ